MKKILVTLALVAMTTGAFAQNFGVRAGANLGNLNGWDADHFALNLGAYVGAVVDLGLPVANLGVHFEPSFSMQGATRKGENALGKWTENIASDYVNVPILIEYKLLGGDLALMAGPQLGVCVGMNGSSKSGSTSINTQYNSTDDYNAFDAGVTLGASYMVTPNVGVDLRWNLGLTNVSKASNTNWNNRVISIGASYMF